MTPLELHDSGLTAKIITIKEHNLLEQSFRLRHDIFVKRLQWVDPTCGDQEKDSYDNHAIIMVVYSDDNNKVLGTVRLIQSSDVFMLEHDFLHCVFGNIFKKRKNSVEISRLAVSPEVVDPKLKKRVLFLLYTLIYKFCVSRDIHFAYIVTTTRLMESLRTKYHLKINLLGDEYFTDTKVGYYAAEIDLQDSFRVIQKITKLPFFKYLKPHILKWI